MAGNNKPRKRKPTTIKPLAPEDIRNPKKLLKKSNPAVKNDLQDQIQEAQTIIDGCEHLLRYRAENPGLQVLQDNLQMLQNNAQVALDAIKGSYQAYNELLTDELPLELYTVVGENMYQWTINHGWPLGVALTEFSAKFDQVMETYQK